MQSGAISADAACALLSQDGVTQLWGDKGATSEGHSARTPEGLESVGLLTVLSTGGIFKYQMPPRDPCAFPIMFFSNTSSMKGAVSWC